MAEKRELRRRAGEEAGPRAQVAEAGSGAWRRSNRELSIVPGICHSRISIAG